MSKSHNICSPRLFAICMAAIGFLSVIFSRPGYSEPARLQIAERKSEIVHVYLLRGLFNVFSLGMNELRGKLDSRGIYATVQNHTAWEPLADEAIADYKQGRVGKIVIVGHSEGALDAVLMADKIGKAGVPVSLVVTLDPAYKPTVTSSNVLHVINLYMPDGVGKKVIKGTAYRGVIQNIDVQGKPLHHMTLDKSNLIQDMVIGYVLEIAKTGGRPAPVKPASTAPRARNENRR
jgi:hypothetical protein